MGGAEERLLEAVKLQDVALVHKLINRGKRQLLSSSKKVNVNYQDAEGFSPLHQASLLGNIDLTFLLIDGNADVDARDKKGLRPLHYSAWKGKVEVIAALLESGASCNAPAYNGCTPLHLASQYGHCKACKILLQYGADVSLRQSDGSNAFDLACEFGREEVVRYLLHTTHAHVFPEQFHRQNPEGDCNLLSSPLHLAARNGHTSVIRMLLQGGADINWRMNSGTCLHEAVANKKPEIVQLLIDCGIDINIRSGLGQTALELAHKGAPSSKSSEIIRKLTDAQPKRLQVYALHDFQNILDRGSLAFTKGTIITVLEQHPNGNWKGHIEGAHGEPPTIGSFPASYVQIYQQSSSHSNMAGSDDSGIHPFDDDVTFNAVHCHRPTGPSLESHNVPPHHYVNLDPSTKLAQSKSHLTKPNVINPSYEDVIYSHQTSSNQPITTHRMPEKPIKNESDHSATKLRRTKHPSLHKGKPSISNPGYEDILLDNTATSSENSPLPNPATSGRTESSVPVAKSAASMVEQSRDGLWSSKCHQQKMMLGVSDLEQAIKHPAHPNSKQIPPMTRPKPKLGMRKSTEKTISTLPDVSNELQKALNKRQKLIDAADRDSVFHTEQVCPRRDSPEKLPPPPPENQVEKSPYRQVGRRHSNSKGPPPEPPKRISSISMDVPGAIDETEKDRCEVDLPPSNGRKHLNKEVFQPSTRLAAPGNKPLVSVKPLATKPKPMKKPSRAKLVQSNDSTASKVTTLIASVGPGPLGVGVGESGKHFDLSALDKECKVHGKPSDQLHVAKKTIDEFGDEFEWPAPPPLDTSSVSYPVNSELFPPPPDSDVELTAQHRTEIEYSGSTSVQQMADVPLNHDARYKPPFPPPHDHTPPPPVPTKQHLKGPVAPHTASGHSDALFLPEDDSVVTQQMLDDITDMFDDLAHEFDDIMS